MNKDDVCVGCGCEASRFLRDKDGIRYCPYCKTKSTYDTQMQDDITKALQAASKHRNEFEFAESLELISEVLEKYPDNPEANWFAMLSAFKIAYIKNDDGIYVPTFLAIDTGLTIPTSPYFNKLTEERKAQALQIEKLRKEALDQEKGIKPYDVFISYKQHEGKGSNELTTESKWANSLYHYLDKMGIRCFYDDECLKGANAGWEPHIYAALRTAKILVLMGSSLEHINSTWVKNEWKRFLSYKNSNTYKQIIVLGLNFDPTLLDKGLKTCQMIRADDGNWIELISQRVSEALSDSILDTVEFKKKTKKKNNRVSHAIENPLQEINMETQNVNLGDDRLLDDILDDFTNGIYNKQDSIDLDRIYHDQVAANNVTTKILLIKYAVDNKLAKVEDFSRHIRTTNDITAFKGMLEGVGNKETKNAVLTIISNAIIDYNSDSDFKLDLIKMLLPYNFKDRNNLLSKILNQAVSDNYPRTFFLVLEQSGFKEDTDLSFLINYTRASMAREQYSLVIKLCDKIINDYDETIFQIHEYKMLAKAHCAKFEDYFCYNNIDSINLEDIKQVLSCFRVNKYKCKSCGSEGYKALVENKIICPSCNATTPVDDPKLDRNGYLDMIFLTFNVSCNDVSNINKDKYLALTDELLKYYNKVTQLGRIKEYAQANRIYSRFEIATHYFKMALEDPKNDKFYLYLDLLMCDTHSTDLDSIVNSEIPVTASNYYNLAREMVAKNSEEDQYLRQIRIDQIKTQEENKIAAEKKAKEDAERREKERVAALEKAKKDKREAKLSKKRMKRYTRRKIYFALIVILYLFLIPLYTRLEAVSFIYSSSNILEIFYFLVGALAIVLGYISFTNYGYSKTMRVFKKLAYIAYLGFAIFMVGNIVIKNEAMEFGDLTMVVMRDGNVAILDNNIKKPKENEETSTESSELYSYDKETKTLELATVSMDGNDQRMVTIIAPKAFKNLDCETVIIPYVKTIGKKAFEGSSVETVVTTDMLDSVGNYAFKGTQLKEIYLGSENLKIKKHSFSKINYNNLGYNVTTKIYLGEYLDKSEHYKQTYEFLREETNLHTEEIIPYCIDEDNHVSSINNYNYFHGYLVIKNNSNSETPITIDFSTNIFGTNHKQLYLDSNVALKGNIFYECKNLKTIIINPDNRYNEISNNLLFYNGEYYTDRTIVIGFDSDLPIEADCVEQYAFSNVTLNEVKISHDPIFMNKPIFVNAKIEHLTLYDASDRDYNSINIAYNTDVNLLTMKNIYLTPRQIDHLSVELRFNSYQEMDQYGNIKSDLVKDEHFSYKFDREKGGILEKFTSELTARENSILLENFFKNHRVDRILSDAFTSGKAMEIDYLTIPDKCRVEGSAFRYAHINKLEFGKDVDLDNYALSYTYLGDVTMADDMYRLSIGLFKNAEIENITIPYENVYIDAQCFMNAKITGEFNNNGIKNIAEEAFKYCDMLRFILEKEGLSYVGSSAFSYTKMGSIVLPKGIVDFGTYIFDGSSNLTTVVIGQTDCSHFSRYFFEGTGIKTVIYLGNPDDPFFVQDMLSIGQKVVCEESQVNSTDSHYYIEDESRIYLIYTDETDECLPLSQVDKYVHISAFALYNTSHTINLQRKNVRNHGFENFRGNAILFNVNELAYDANAFNNSSLNMLSTVPSYFSQIPSGLKYNILELYGTVQDGQFENIRLSNVIVRDGRIGERAFNNCGLNSVELYDVTDIGMAAFANNNISKIFIPSTVQTMGNIVFAFNPYCSIYCEDTKIKSGWERYWNCKDDINQTYSTYWGCSRN